MIAFYPIHLYYLSSHMEWYERLPLSVKHFFVPRPWLIKEGFVLGVVSWTVMNNTVFFAYNCEPLWHHVFVLGHVLVLDLGLGPDTYVDEYLWTLWPHNIYIYIYILNLSIKFIKTIEWHVMIGHVQIPNHWATHILLLRNGNFIIYIHFKYIYKKLIDTSCFNPFWILAWYKKNLIIYKKHTWRGWKKIKSLNILVNIYLF